VHGPDRPTIYLKSDTRSYTSAAVTVFHTVYPPLPVCEPLSRLVFATHRLTLLIPSTRPPLAGRRPAHGSCCPLEADRSMTLGFMPRQSKDVNSQQFTVSSKTQYLCARTGARRHWRVWGLQWILAVSRSGSHGTAMPPDSLPATCWTRGV
jgi:hypothetical protein